MNVIRYAMNIIRSYMKKQPNKDINLLLTLLLLPKWPFELRDDCVQATIMALRAE